MSRPSRLGIGQTVAVWTVAFFMLVLSPVLAWADFEWFFSGQDVFSNSGTGTGTYGGNSWFNLTNWDYYVDNSIEQSARITTEPNPPPNVTDPYAIFGAYAGRTVYGSTTFFSPPWITTYDTVETAQPYANPPPLVNDPANTTGFDGRLFPYSYTTGSGFPILNAANLPAGKSQLTGLPQAIVPIPEKANAIPFGDPNNGGRVTLTFIGMNANDWNNQNYPQNDPNPAHGWLNPSTAGRAIFDPANDTANTTPDNPATTDVNEHLEFTAGRIYVGGTTSGVLAITIDGVAQDIVRSGTMEIRSGTLTLRNDLQLGRGGAKADGGGVTGTVIVRGGNLLVPTNTNLVLGPNAPGNAQFAASVGRGIFEYHGGNFTYGAVDANSNDTGTGSLNVASASQGSPAAGFVGSTESKVIIYNDGPAGHFRAPNLQFALGNASGAIVGNSGPVLATAEFHFSNGGVRPLQVANNLTLNNSTVVDATPGSPTNGLTVPSRVSRLNLVLDAVPAVTAGVPLNLGLIDVDSGINAIVDNLGNPTGKFDSNGNFSGAVNNGGTFYATNNVTQYTDGATVSAIYGNTQYNWKIHYNGKITWGSTLDGATIADYNNSKVFNIDWQAAPPDGSYKDVVLIGDSSQVSLIKGDLDRDGHVTGNDIQAMLIALTGVGAFAATNHLTTAEVSQLGDVNSSGTFTNADLQFLIGLLIAGNGSQAVPEPASLAMLCAGLAVVAAARLRRRASAKEKSEAADGRFVA